MTVRDFLNITDGGWDVHIDLLNKNGKLIYGNGINILYDRKTGNGMLREFTPYLSCKILNIKINKSEWNDEIILITMTLDYF